jgi:hypothetical protein
MLAKSKTSLRKAKQNVWYLQERKWHHRSVLGVGPGTAVRSNPGSWKKISYPQDLIIFNEERNQCSRFLLSQEGKLKSHLYFTSLLQNNVFREIVFFTFPLFSEKTRATIGALANLTTATAMDRGMTATLTEANARLVKQLEDNSNVLLELMAFIKNERIEKRGQRSFNPPPSNYCWTHVYKVGNTHTSLSCNFPKQGHKREATQANNMGGRQANKE